MIIQFKSNISYHVMDNSSLTLYPEEKEILIYDGLEYDVISFEEAIYDSK